MPLGYHEQQSMQLCAVHAINNLLQASCVSKSSLDAICMQLNPSSWLNPHRSVLGTGNYDVNVITAALNQHHFSFRWFDIRKPASSIAIDEEAFVGIMLNIRRPRLLPWPYPESRHWFTLRPDNEGVMFNTDSYLEEACPFASRVAMLDFVQATIDSSDAHVFIVEKAPPQQNE